MEETQHKIVSELMQQSKLTMPFSDFEDHLMKRIEVESKLQPALHKDRKWALFFFVTGTLLGLLLNTILENIQSGIAGISKTSLQLGFQMIFVLLFLIQLEKFFPFQHWFSKVNKRSTGF